MEIKGNKEKIELLHEAVRHYRLDILDFLENGALAETNPEFKKEVASYRDLRHKAQCLDLMEDEISQILLNQ